MKVWLKKETLFLTKKALILATKSNNVLQAGMYTDVHWSFILLFSQVIFLFKEPCDTVEMKGTLTSGISAF